jgi:hypothetical protein
MAAVETREAEGDGAAKVLADDLYDDASDIHATSEKSQKLTKGDRAPDGFIVHSHAGDDWQECRDYVREKAGLGAFKPNGQGRKRPSSTASQGPRVVDETYASQPLI